jgi:hypothetical protein
VNSGSKRLNEGIRACRAWRTASEPAYWAASVSLESYNGKVDGQQIGHATAVEEALTQCPVARNDSYAFKCEGADGLPRHGDI